MSYRNRLISLDIKATVDEPHYPVQAIQLMLQSLIKKLDYLVEAEQTETAELPAIIKFKDTDNMTTMTCRITEL